MQNRIKVGDVVFELPQGALPSPVCVVAEKTDMPEALDPVAFMRSEPDLVAQYIARPASIVEKPTEPELDQLTMWQAFAGAKSSYPQEWLKYEDGKQKHCGFNMRAFYFGLQWYLFHRIYVQGIVIALLEVSLAIIAAIGTKDATSGMSATIIAVAILVPRLISGLWANVALLGKAKREIKRIQAFSIDNQRKLAMIASAGAGGVVPLLLLYLLAFVLKLIWIPS